MGHDKIEPVAGLSSGFAGEAANDILPMHEQLLVHMECDKEGIIGPFRDQLLEIFKQMNMMTAMTRQSRQQEGLALPGEELTVIDTHVGVWLSIEMPMWDEIIDSYMDDLHTNDPEKFNLTYQQLGIEAFDYYQRTATHLDGKAVRMAFENIYKDQMASLEMVADIMRHHLPMVTVTPYIAHIGDDHITPAVRISAPEGEDLRDVVRAFIEAKSSMRVVKPEVS